VGLVFANSAIFIQTAAENLVNSAAHPSLSDVTRSIAGYTAALAELRLDGVIDHLTRNEAGRIDALSFGLDQLRRDLESLTRSAESFDR
jgi:hypothetical protein